jgi:hypothetical protein
LKFKRKIRQLNDTFTRHTNLKFKKMVGKELEEISDERACITMMK